MLAPLCSRALPEAPLLSEAGSAVCALCQVMHQGCSRLARLALGLRLRPRAHVRRIGLPICDIAGCAALWRCPAALRSSTTIAYISVDPYSSMKQCFNMCTPKKLPL